MKKVLIVTEYFYPYNSTGAPKVIGELAEDLKEAGMEIEVITSKLNYNAPLIKDIPKNEVYKGINIKRVWSTLGDKNKPIKRILNYVTFIGSLFVQVIKKKDYDCMIILSNPPITTIIGYLAKIIRKKKFIFIIHDLYPDIAVKLGAIKEKSMISKIINSINQKVFETAEKVIVIGRDMYDVVLSKGVPKEKLEIITNWANSQLIYSSKKNNDFSRLYNIENKFNIIYTGNIGRFHDLETLVETAKLLKNEKEIQFLIIGEGFKKKLVLELKEKYELNNLIILGYQDEEIYNQVLSSADLLVSALEEGVEGLAVPSKTYSYFAASKPIIGIMNKNSEIGMTIEENNIGVCIANGESEKLKEFILNIKNNKKEHEEMCKRVKRLFDDNYERKVVTKKFYDLINSFE